MESKKAEESREKWNRHTLIWITPEGRGYAAEHIFSRQWETDGCEADVWKRLLVQDGEIPGIICCQPERRDGFWLAGFSHWEYQNGSRMRMQAYVPENMVWKSCSPFELCAGEEREKLVRKYPEMREVWEAADHFGLEAGLYGSTALEWVTKRPYRNKNSDFDIYLRTGKKSDLKGFGQKLQKLEESRGVRFDAEVEIGGFGVKLKELMGNRKTFLGKGLYDAELLMVKDLPVVFR